MGGKERFRLFLALIVVGGGINVGCGLPKTGSSQNNAFEEEAAQKEEFIKTYEPPKQDELGRDGEFVKAVEGGETLAPTQTETPVETPTEMSTSTVIPTVTPTAEPTLTPIPLATDTSLPTATRELVPTVSGWMTRTPTPEVLSTMEALSKSFYPINRGNPSRNEVAIAYDDGYDAKATEKVLDALKKYNVKITFFVTGQYFRAYPDLWKRAVKEGHQVCNHTYSHPKLAELPVEGIQKEIKLWEEAAGEVLGKDYLEKMRKEFPFVRLPYCSGCDDPKVLKVVADMGLIPISWGPYPLADVLPKNEGKESSVISKAVSEKAVESAYPGAIFLLHLNVWESGAEEIIEGLKKKSLTPVTVSEIIR